MEWTVHEQMLFLGESICLGVLMGILLDIFSGFVRNRTKAYRFWLDVIFGPLAAVILFMGSLVIMDGQLHPLLLLGALAGALLEHVTIGQHLAKTVVFLRKCARRLTKIFGKKFTGFFEELRKMGTGLSRWLHRMRKMMKKDEK